MRRPRPWLWLPPQLAHDLGPRFMAAYGAASFRSVPIWNPHQWRNLTFPNRLGIAGGVDKDGVGLSGWWKAGAGFAEIGTVTPQPQPGNTGKRVARDLASGAVWNRLGFPSHGMMAVAKRLAKVSLPHQTPLFANLGKNATTPLESAHLDYMEVAEALASYVDGFVVNISSPNTQGLRELLQPARLQDFLTPLSERFRKLKKHWLLKLSPDVNDADLENALRVSIAAGVDGWVITNTTQGERSGLKFPDGGGVSGRPLAPKSRAMLQTTLNMLGSSRGDRLIVSAGGVLTPADVDERLNMGADLVQVYSALVFSGPFFFRQVAQWQRARK